ncbi:MAG: long-chain-fatty-acid--CoA ligase [Brachymonas sp.]|nr:long-chain-fatty-acid--CoA ligase [Brachymonas sp.]
MNVSAASRPWLGQYPQSVPADLPPLAYTSMIELLEESFGKFADLPAASFLGSDMTYSEWDKASRRMAAYLQSLGLQRGDRVAVMMPNIPQYMVAVAAILRAGLVLVNVNPLYTARELEHQLKDSGAKAIFIVENFAHTLQQCLDHTDIKHIVLATFGDRLGALKGWVVNLVLRHVKKLVPPFSLPTAVGFNDALAKFPAEAWQRPQVGLDDIAVLQYTGGTTGVAKGAVLLQRNILSNVVQCDLWYEPGLRARPLNHQVGFVCALPLYHIFAFTVNLLLCAKQGGKSILLPNPRDLPSVFKELSKHQFHSFPAVNTLFNAMAHHPDFNKVDWSHLRISVGGGMAVQSAVAKLWLEKTGCPICEGYGLSETSPVATCNPVTLTEYTGTIGIPVPGTYVKLVDDNDQEVTTLGERGEIAIKGPQVMAGYWQRPDETAKVMTADGYFKTGDIGTMDERGYFTIVDRKKDMILVSGFNVYPSEVEEVVASVPGVLECAAIGVPDENSGEKVKVFIVSKPGATVTEEDIKAHAKANLTGYKRPRLFEFRETLPKSPVGKILRRELREEELQKTAA